MARQPAPPVGVETQWRRRTTALGQTTPSLLGLFSLVMLLARTLHPTDVPTRQAAWYAKEQAPCADALAAVWRHPREHWNSEQSEAAPDVVQISRPRWTSLTDLLAYAA